MKIDRIHIDGFGEYVGRSLLPQSRPVTIFYGPNEAGKSTLLAFIRMVLFGFPSPGAAKHFPPLAGGSHGGRIEFVTDAGDRCTLERRCGPKGGPMAITAADGSPVNDSALSRLRGHTSGSTFESVFAFGLDELRKLESVDDDGINNGIYSAGTGAARLPQALKLLKERAASIYARKGSKQPVARVLGELQDIEGQLRTVLSQSQDYGDAELRSAQLEKESAVLDADHAAARSRVDELNRWQRSWAEGIALLDVEAQLSEIPDRTGFPDDPIVRLSDLEDRLREVEESVVAATSTLQCARDEAERAIEGEDLLLIAETVEAIRLGRGSFDASVRDLPKRNTELVANETDLAQALRDLGPGWSEERLHGFDTSIPRRDEVEQWKTRLASANADARDRIRDVEQATRAVNEANQRLEDRRNQLAQHDAGASNRMSPEAPREQRLALQVARSRLAEYDQVVQRCADLEAQAGGEPESPLEKLPNRGALLVFLGVILLVMGLGVASVLVFEGETILGTGIALLALGLVAYTVSRSSATRGDGRKLNRLTAEARRHAEERRAALLAVLPPLALDLQLGQVPGRDQLNEVETVLVRSEERQRQRVQLLATVEGVAQDVERAQERSSAAGRLQYDQHAVLDAVVSGWKTWLTQYGLPETLTADTVPELFSRVETARVVARTATEKHDRIAAIEMDIDDYSRAVKAVTDGYAVSGIRTVSDGDDSSMAIAQRADRIVERFDETQEAVRARAEAVRAAEERDANLKEVVVRRTSVKARVHDLIFRVHADDTEQFRLWARQHLERRQLDRKQKQHLSALRAVWGHEQDLDALRRVFASTTKEETDDALLRVESELAELASRTTEQIEERGRLKERMQSLSSDEVASRLRGRREELVEELRELAAQWSKLVVARSLLVRTRNKYEEERRPDVVRRAETFFKRLTGGKYAKLHVTLGEQEISVIDDNGRRKVPEQLSRGTREQLYLALRFGLIQSMGGGGERLPVVVDEVLVNFDLDRARRAAIAFVELSRTNQVLVLTCHQWMVDLFTEAEPDAAVIDLSAV
jgi:uncharacterized protein YhaN